MNAAQERRIQKRGVREHGVREHDRALRRFAASITLITVLGHTLLGFEQAYLTPIVGVLTGVIAEFVLETVEAWARRRPARYLGVPREQVVDFFLPSYISGLACAMLLYGNAHLMPTVLAVLIGVGSTYVFRVRVPGTARRPGEDVPGRHCLNPSNFGIIVVLLLFPWVGVAPPYQFTGWVSGPFDAIVPLVVLVLGSMVNAKLTGRLPLILGWVGGFVLQGFLRGWLTDISVISALLPMTGVAFILYTDYIVADPGTSPSKARDQIAFGLSTAAVYGLLVQFHIVFGLFFALTIVCAGRALILSVLARVHPLAAPSSVPLTMSPSVSPSVPVSAHGLSKVSAGTQP